MAKYNIRNLKFLKQNILIKNGKEKLLLNDSSFLSNLKNTKKKYYLYNQNLISFYRCTLFSLQHLFLIFADEGTFFQEYVEMELKIFLIIFEEFFEWQK